MHFPQDGPDLSFSHCIIQPNMTSLRLCQLISKPMLICQKNFQRTKCWADAPLQTSYWWNFCETTLKRCFGLSKAENMLSFNKMPICTTSYLSINLGDQSICCPVNMVLQRAPLSAFVTTLIFHSPSLHPPMLVAEKIENCQYYDISLKNCLSPLEAHLIAKNFATREFSFRGRLATHFYLLSYAQPSTHRGSAGRICCLAS